MSPQPFCPRIKAFIVLPWALALLIVSIKLNPGHQQVNFVSLS